MLDREHAKMMKNLKGGTLITPEDGLETPTGDEELGAGGRIITVQSSV